MRKKRKKRGHHSEEEFHNDINIVPILDAIIALVIFLLFAVSAITIKKLDIHSYGEQVVDASQPTNLDDDFQIPELKILENGSFEFDRQSFEKIEEVVKAAKTSKKKHPFNFQIIVRVSNGVNVGFVSEILSKLRKLDEPFKATAKDGNQVEISLLFPDAILEDV